MSSIEKVIDLSLYGCPMHYIKAREAIKKLELDMSLILEVNNGDAIDEVLASLRQDGQLCEVTSTGTLTSQIRVTRKQ
jgi:TusA-related sulfurtransferase